MRQIPKYFRYQEYHEIADDELRKAHADGKRFILVVHPHGVFSFVGVCSAIVTMCEPNGIGPKLPTIVPTAVASVIRTMPLLKDLLGVFGIIDAAGKTLHKHLSRKNSSLVLYVGGIAELFASSSTREAVYIHERKGFIKLALRSGADVIPVYLFGNTTVLEVIKGGFLERISRKVGVTLTFFWGRFGLPVPRAVKMTYARGRPLGLPQIDNPTDADVEEWHAKYCTAVKKLFDDYKGYNPDYADKELEMM